MDLPDEQEDGGAAPRYTIPPRRLGALEHPMIIKNLDKGIKTFGQNNALQGVWSNQISLQTLLNHALTAIPDP
jgi:hypothetical protein